MSKLTDKLLWEKYRPTTLRSTILMPRIKKIIDLGIRSNMIFYGRSGTGKSTVANILSKEHNYLKINASKETGIDTLRGKIEDHITSLTFGSNATDIKVIYLDEFDRTSKSFQDGLKGFIEEYEDRARFIFTTNHINRIEPELKSRFDEISFDPIDPIERKFLFDSQVKFLRGISKKEEFDLYQEKKPFDRLVSKYFPDLRKSIVVLDRIIMTGDASLIDGEDVDETLGLYDFIMARDIDPVVNYDYIMDNHLTDFDYVFVNMGRPFFVYLTEKHPDIVMNKGAAIIELQSEINSLLETTPDPIILLINYVLKMKKILLSE